MEASMVNVYAPNTEGDQLLCWEEFISLRREWNSGWIVGGDFNTVTSRRERSGCKFPSNGMSEFVNFITDCGLVDLPLVGKKFTWFGDDNKRSRLDRFLVDDVWCLKYNDIAQIGLNLTVSDHISIFLLLGDRDWGPRPFKFINAWMEKEDCKQVLCEAWNKAEGSSQGIAFKLKKEKLVLKQWNRNSCGDFDRRIVELERKIETLDSRKEGSILNSSEFEDLRNCNMNYGTY
ncbi:hypothetical protein V6N13_122580 [Hibiscus sabdariffa]